MDLFEEWSQSATETVHINLTRNGNFLYNDAFHPTFTHTVLGEEEVIIGYKDLKINLSFRAHDLKPSVKIKYGQKMQPLNEDMAQMMDVEAKLRKFLPEAAFDKSSPEADNTSTTWKPPGTLHHTYTTSSGKTFQIYQSPLTNPATLAMMKNILILIPFFIESGTTGLLDEPDWSLERWNVFFLYEVDKNENYTLAGLSTSYRAWVFPTLPGYSAPPEYTSDQSYKNLRESPFSIFHLASRERISQFIILPPYQSSSGHGSHLYNAMTSKFRADKWVFEITVEEPNEEFDALRDYCDMAYLTSLPCLPDCKTSFAEMSIPDRIGIENFNDTSPVPTDLIVNTEDATRIRTFAKIAPRQFNRLVEIHLLSTIPRPNRSTSRITRKYSSADANDRRYYFWRLLVKERIFMKNRDQLLQIDEGERVQKVEDALLSVQEERMVLRVVRGGIKGRLLTMKMMRVEKRVVSPSRG
ncbi:acyl-CoA N-acyltransferase [Tothia fuscella]|uniref:Histone acetyltransferase type B catalytic subunit n=1 Tax=Tothia fuscella TaxID=1048955 RepID=A0A9P4TVA7_9PEZI|nr:acyl-CoA N-acyltransferase [Tothia fuscella]